MRKFIQKARRLAEIWNCESGNALVEAAIVLPLGILLLAGGWELGRGLSYYHAVDKAVRDAARYVARLPQGIAYDQARARNLVLYGNWDTTAPSGIQTSVYPGTISTFSIDAGRFAAGFVSLEADVSYTFPLLSIFRPSSTLVFRVKHEQPFIGG